MNAFTISLYLGYAVYSIFPYSENVLSIGGTPLMRTILSIVIYAVFVIVSYFIVKRVVTRSGRSRLPAMILQVVLLIGFLLALGYHSFAITRIYAFPPIVNTIFDPTTFFFWWFIAPLIVLFLLER
ncbi:hypothetical protein H0X32_01615 [Patescibacteria group bacterium]|nr:hypothetical protein [Patescibacteria group bacterium]